MASASLFPPLCGLNCQEIHNLVERTWELCSDRSVETRDRMILLLRDIRESLGEFAWVILGILLVLGIFACFVALKWIRRGGIGKHQQEVLCRTTRSKTGG